MKDNYIFILSPVMGFFMLDYQLTAFIITIVSLFMLGVFLLINCFKRKIKISVKLITRTAIFASISAILYIVPYLKFPLFFFPSFLEIHFDEIPALIAGFAYGPLCGSMVIIIKTIIKLPFTSTLCVGEIADLIYGLILVIPSAIYYRKKRNIKGAIIGLSVASVIQIVVSSFLTTFVMLDFYMNVMGLSKEIILSMCQASNPNVTSLDWNFLLLVALPFNAFKDILLFVLTLLLYKRIKKLIDRIAI